MSEINKMQQVDFLLFSIVVPYSLHSTYPKFITM